MSFLSEFNLLDLSFDTDSNSPFSCFFEAIFPQRTLRSFDHYVIVLERSLMLHGMEVRLLDR